MKLKISIIYSWFVRTLTYFLPNLPIIMRIRGFLYSLMMEKCGKDFQVASSAILNSLLGLKVGDHVYIGSNTVFIGVDITLEDEVLIGPNCVISGANHVFQGGSFRFAKSQGEPVIIKQGAWIAANCTVTAGSILPERSILAAGAVLSRDFSQPDAVYGGVPAKYLKTISQ